MNRLTPKVEATKERTRLTMQEEVVKGAPALGGMPPGGWYILVVDTYPVDKTTTRVESYFRFSAFQPAFAAIKPWLVGPDPGRPDLTQ